MDQLGDGSMSSSQRKSQAGELDRKKGKPTDDSARRLKKIWCIALKIKLGMVT